MSEAMPLIPDQRHQRLLQLLRRDGVLSIRRLTAELDVSHMTVRRDIAVLEDAGHVVSVPGGVRLAGTHAVQPPAARGARAGLELPRKRSIGAAAATLVTDGATVFLDAGTTVHTLVPHLVDRTGLTVVTNDFHLVQALLPHPGIEVVHTGGLLDRDSGSAAGRLAAATLAELSLDLAVLSTGAWNLAGVTSAREDKVDLKRAALALAGTTVLVADSTKFGSAARFRVAGLDRFDIVVSDADLPGEAAAQVRTLDVDLRLA